MQLQNPHRFPKIDHRSSRSSARYGNDRLARHLAGPKVLRATLELGKLGTTLLGRLHPALTDLVRNEISRLRTAYVTYAASLTRLPQGSLLVGNAVACSAGLAVRLTERIVFFTAAPLNQPVRNQQCLGKAVGDLNRTNAARTTTKPTGLQAI